MATQPELHFSITATNEDLKRKLAESRQAILDSGKTAEATASRIDGSFKRMAASAAALGGGVALGAMANELYGFANAFDKSMREVSTISETVSAEMNGFKQSVLDMTTQIPVGANDAAKALYQIISAGHDGAKGMQVLEVSAKAAIGGVTETATAADAITTVLNAYKKGSAEAESISDQLFTTVRLGKTTFGELGRSISQAVPIAASFGIETEQVLAAVATLTKSGTPTAQAMTQIRASIIASSKVLGDGYFKVHTFQEGLAEIAKRANGSEAELRKLIPEIEGINGVLGLTGLNAKTAAADLAALGDSGGATQQAYIKMKEGAEAQLTLLKNNTLKQFHEIGEGGLNVMGSLAKAMNTAFETGAIDDLVAIMGVLVATVGVYKAQLMVTNAVKLVGNNIVIAEEIKAYKALLPAKEASKNKDIEILVSKGHLSQKRAEELIAIRAQVQAQLEELKVKAQIVQAELAAAIRAHKSALQRSIAVRQNMALAQSQMQIAIRGGSVEEIAAAKTAARTAKLEVNSSAIAVNTTRQALGTVQSQASAAATAVDTMQTNINSAATRGATTAKNLFTAATGRLTKAFHSLKLAFASNPIGMILTGVTMAISLFSMFSNKIGSVTDKYKALAASIEGEVNKALADETAKLQSLRRQLSETEPSSKRRIDLIKELKREYPDIIGNIDAESAALDKVIGSIDNYISKLKDKIRLQVLEQKYFQNIKAVEDAKIALATGGDRDDYDKVAKRVRIENALILDQLEYLQNLVKYSKEYADLQKERKSFGDVEVVSMLPRNPDSKIDYENNAKAFENAAKQGGRPLDKLEPYEEYLKRFEKNLTEADEKATRLQIVNNRIAEIENEAPMIAGGGGGTSVQASKAAKDYSDEKIAEMLRLEQLKISVMQQGRIKELAQIELTRKEKLAALDKEQKELAKKQGKPLSTEQAAGLNTERTLVGVEANKGTASINKKYDDEIADHWKALTTVFLSEEQKRTGAIKDRYDKQRQWVDETFDENMPGMMPLNMMFKMKIDNSENEEQTKVYQEQLKSYEAFTSEYISKAEEFDGRIKDMQNNGASLDEIANISSVQNEILAKLEGEMNAKSETFTVFAKQVVASGLEELLQMLELAQSSLEAAKSNGLSDGVDVEGLKTQISFLQQRILALTSKKGEKVTGDPTKKWKNTLSVMNDVKQLTSDVIGNFDGLDDTTKIVLDSAMNIATGVINMIIGITTLAAGSAVATTTVATTASAAIRAVETASVILAIISAAIQITMAIANALKAVFNDDKSREQEIERLQGQIDSLQKSYDLLGKAIEKAYSTDASQLLEQSNELLEKQKQLIQLQIAEEESKKDSDGGQIESWKKQLEEIDQEIEENKEKAIDVIFGADVESAIDDFASAYMDAWSSGEDRAQAQKDVVKKMLRNIIQEMLKTDIGKQVAIMREKIAGFMSDDKLDDSELAAIDSMGNEIGKIMEERGKLYDKILKDNNSTQNEQTLVGQIKGNMATEASVDELGGMLRGQHDRLISIDNRLAIGFQNLVALAKTNAMIEANTRATAANTAQTVITLASGFTAMQTELTAINKNTTKDTGSYGS